MKSHAKLFKCFVCNNLKDDQYLGLERRYNGKQGMCVCKGCVYDIGIVEVTNEMQKKIVLLRNGDKN